MFYIKLLNIESNFFEEEYTNYITPNIKPLSVIEAVLCSEYCSQQVCNNGIDAC